MSSLGRDRTLVCIGFMGAGKSTAARSAASALGFGAIDVDEVIEERLVKPIERVFAEDGEAAFREAEERITVELLSAAEPWVLALGGGAIGSSAVRDALSNGYHRVIWLDVSLDTAWARAHGTGRPLAREHAQFARLHAEREPFAAELADATRTSTSSSR